MLRYWDLPGPATFAVSVRNNLLDGVSVALRLPDHTPDGLKQRICDAGDVAFHTINVSDTNRKPIEVLFDAFVPRPDRERLSWTTNSLVAHEAFQGHHIWLDGVTAIGHDLWNAFLLDFEHASRDIDLLRRSAFVVVLNGEQARRPFATGVALVERSWGRDHSRFDALFLADQLMTPLELPVLHRRVAIALAAELALWDAELLQRLVSAGHRALQSPLGVLRELARDRGWDPHTPLENGNSELAWARGAVAWVDGRQYVHLAAEPEDTRDLATRNRIWRAQLTTVMPFIEEVRQATVREFRAQLREYAVRELGLDSELDLEIADVHHALARDGAVPNTQRRLLSDLRQARNKLAHIKTLTWEEIPREYPASSPWL